MWKNKYFLKLIALVLLISTLPVAILGLFSYSRTAESAKEKAEQASITVLQQFQLRIEQELDLSEKLTKHLAASVHVLQATRKPLDERDFELIQQLVQDVNYLQFAQPGVKEASLISLDQHWMIHTSRTVSSYYGHDYAARYADVLTDKRSAFWSARLAEAKGVIQYIVKIPQFSEQPTGLLIVDLLLEELGGGNDSGALMALIDPSNRVLGNSPQGTDIFTEDVIDRIRAEGNMTGSLLVHANGADHAVYFRKSTTRDWIFASIIPIHMILADSRMIGRIAFLIGAMVLAAITITAYLVSTNLYRPIHRLHLLLLATMGSGQASGKRDEFAWIRERVDDLLESRSKWRLHLPQLKELFLLKLLRGEATVQEIRDKQQLFGCSLDHVRYSVLSIEVDELEKTHYEEKDRDLLLFACRNVIEELLPSSNQLGPVLVNKTLVTMVLDDSEGVDGASYGTSSQALTFAERIQASLKEWLKLSVSIGISKTYFIIKHVPKAFYESQRALTHRLRLGSEFIIEYRDLDQGKEGRFYYPQYLEMQLLDAVRSVDRVDANSKLRLLLQEIFEEYRSQAAYELAIARLVSSLIQTLHEAGGSLSVFSQDQPWLERLCQLRSRKEVEEAMLHLVLLPIMERIEEHNGLRFQSISQEMERIIHERIETDITLDFCAEQLHYNASYLGRVFKRETGKGFSDYVAECRLKAAKELLLETDLTLAEIAVRLQYHDAPNFSRYFKKMVGVSPGKYRQACRDSAIHDNEQ